MPSVLELNWCSPFSLVGALYPLLPSCWLSSAVCLNFFKSSLYWLEL
uniref:Proline-rich receptor-like protein kinase PERK1 n=1 Tax=Rhizophora mucronata TaxID=61149 RepID=A0A2P2QEM2_RHIMU